MSDSKWIEFENRMVEYGRKTSIWFVRAKEYGDKLGEVKWFGRWRKYCFFSEPHSVFEQDCLRDIADFIGAKTKEHRNERKSAETSTQESSSPATRA